MPLRKDSKRRSDVTDPDSKTADVMSNTIDCQQESENYEEEEDDDETQDAWLESLGVENSEIKKINHSQVCGKYCAFPISSDIAIYFRRE